MTERMATLREPEDNAPQATPIERNRAFLAAIQALYESDRGRIAALKRNTGKTLAEARGLHWFHFYLRRHFREKSDRDATLCLLVAGLMCLDRATMRHGIAPTGVANFGATLALLRSPAERAAPRPGNTPVERRLIALLDAGFDENNGGEMAFRLQQAVKLVFSKPSPDGLRRVDWPQLLEDLRYWGHTEKFAQKRWARSFYDVGPQEDGENPNGSQLTENGGGHAAPEA